MDKECVGCGHLFAEDELTDTGDDGLMCADCVEFYFEDES